jgi:hypothetical protein
MTTPTPELNKALAAFQAELPRVAKGNTADTGSYKYAYADIEDVFGTVLPRLGKHGLAFTAVTTIRDDGQRILEYALLHGSGEERGGQYPLPAQATSQQMGSALTYARRYCLLAITGVAPGGDDDDGKAASDGHEQAPAPARPKPVPVTRTDGDNPWRQSAPTFAAAIVAEFKRLGVEDPDVRLGHISALTGRTITRPSDLSNDEKKQLLAVLSHLTSPEGLRNYSRQEAVT